MHVVFGRQREIKSYRRVQEETQTVLKRSATKTSLLYELNKVGTEQNGKLLRGSVTVRARAPGFNFPFLFL